MLLNMKQMTALFQVSRVSIYQWVKVGRIPKPVNKFGSPRWDRDKAIEAFQNYEPEEKAVKFRAAV